MSETTPRPQPEFFTSSQIKSALRCLRHHHYSYRLGYRPKETAAALRFGSLFHAGTEAWWVATPSDRLPAALAAMREHRDTIAASTDETLDEYAYAMAEALMIAYDARWGKEPLKPVAVEEQFRFHLVDEFTDAEIATMGGQMDNVVRNTETGQLFLMERKTSGDDITPGSEYWEALALDHQVSTYYAGAHSLGFDVAGCIYDVIGKPKLKPYKATPPEKIRYKKDGTPYAGTRLEDETPEEYKLRLMEAIAAEPERYFQRGTVARSGRQMIEFHHDMADAVLMIRSGMKTRNPGACRMWNRMCEYFPVCSGQTTIEDETRYRKLEVVHEELQEQQGEESEG